MQEIGPPTATDEKKTSLLYFGRDDFSGWYNFAKITKIVATDVTFYSYQIRFRLGLSPAGPTLGELTELPQTH